MSLVSSTRDDTILSKYAIENFRSGDTIPRDFLALEMLDEHGQVVSFSPSSIIDYPPSILAELKTFSIYILSDSRFLKT